MNTIRLNENPWNKPWHKITIPFYVVKRKLYDVWRGFRKRCQRFKYGYSESDLWNMDSWFIDIIQRMLIHFRDNAVGYPACITEDEWNLILEEMIDCLSLMDEDEAEKYITKNGFYPFSDEYKAKYELMNKNKKRFFELFEEWFYYLWT